MRNATLLILSLPLLAATHLSAQALGPASTGPVLDAFGPVYAVEAPSFETSRDAVYRVVFEVGQGAPAPDALNARIETVARFLNMHAQAGVPRENLKAVLVLHGTAGKDVLGNEAYRERFGSENPNTGLVRALLEFGVQVVLCGQTQMHRGLAREDLMPGVDVALSAMTALITLQSRGYALIAF